MSEPMPRNWWQRNWKWAVPVGCVGMLALAAAIVAGIVVLAGAAMRSTDAYRQALDRAADEPRVVEALGSPIEPGLFTSGSVKVEGPSGSASLAIPVHGPRGAGTLYVEAKKSAGRWQLGLLELEPEGGGARIDLLAGGPPADEAAPPAPERAPGD